MEANTKKEDAEEKKRELNLWMAERKHQFELTMAKAKKEKKSSSKDDKKDKKKDKIR